MHSQRVGVLVIAAAFLSGYLVTACRLCPAVDSGVVDDAGDIRAYYSTLYFLEIHNAASDRVRIQITMQAQWFWTPLEPLGQQLSTTSVVFPVESGEKRKFRMVAGPGRLAFSENNVHVRFFRAIRFFAPGAETPHASYTYPSFDCSVRDPDTWWGDDPACSDDTFVYDSADETTERLFVQSPDRPFFLERDKEDSDLGRLVIASVPRAISDASDIAVGVGDADEPKRSRRAK